MRNKEAKGYHKLIIWQKLQELLRIVYQLTEKLPKSEEFGLKSQMRRAIVSVISNFVEGYMKKLQKKNSTFWRLQKPHYLSLKHKQRFV